MTDAETRKKNTSPFIVTVVIFFFFLKKPTQLFFVRLPYSVLTLWMDHAIRLVCTDHLWGISSSWHSEQCSSVLAPVDIFSVVALFYKQLHSSRHNESFSTLPPGAAPSEAVARRSPLQATSDLDCKFQVYKIDFFLLDRSNRSFDFYCLS